MIMKKGIALLLAFILLFSASLTGFADYENTYTLSGNLSADMVGTAITQIGYSGTKYGQASDAGTEFLSWCAYEAAIPDKVIPKMANIDEFYAFFENKKEIHTDPDYLPVSGDILFFGTEEAFTSCGLVTEADNDYITVILSDTDNCVKKKMYALTSEKIQAVASPDYGYVQESEAGKYLTIASALNFRAQPDINAAILASIPMGTIVTVTDFSGDWGKTSYNGTDGWIHMDYAIPYTPSNTNDSEYAVEWNVIDVSKWQGAIDWTKVAAGNIDAVILRIGYRGTKTKQVLMDETFLTNYEGASKAGLPIGCYFYSAATNITEAKEEANFILQTILDNNLTFSMPIYLDMEAAVVERTGREMIQAITQAFFDVMEEANMYAGVYCSTSWATDYYTDAFLNGHPLWIADWREQCGYAGEYGMWQYTDSGSVSGVEARYTDLSHCYVDYPKLIADKNYNIPLDKNQPRERGDVDGDGAITAADARIALRISAKIYSPSEAERTAADIDRDGTVTASDARTLLRVSAGLERLPSLPEENSSDA